MTHHVPFSSLAGVKVTMDCDLNTVIRSIFPVSILAFGRLLEDKVLRIFLDIQLIPDTPQPSDG